MKEFMRFISAKDMSLVDCLFISLGATFFGTVVWTANWWVGIIVLVVVPLLGMVLTEVFKKYGEK